LAGRRVLLVRETAAEPAAIDTNRDAAALAAALDRARELDVAGFGVDDAHIDRQVSLGRLAAETDALEAQATARARGIFLECGHGAGDQILRPGNLADLRARAFCAAAGSREILFFEHGLQLLPFDDAKGAARRQLIRKHAGQFPAHAAVPPWRAGLVRELRAAR